MLQIGSEDQDAEPDIETGAMRGGKVDNDAHSPSSGLPEAESTEVWSLESQQSENLSCGSATGELYFIDAK